MQRNRPNPFLTTCSSPALRAKHKAFVHIHILASQVAIDMFLDEESQSLAMLCDFGNLFRCRTFESNTTSLWM